MSNNYFGTSFIYNDRSSEEFDLRISDFEASGVKTGPAGADINLLQKYIPRRSTPYYYGRTIQTPLEINLTVNKNGYLSSQDRNMIASWLLGQMDYSVLQIVQNDMDGILFNVIFDKCEVNYVSNVATGFKLHGVCKDPWGWDFPKIYTLTNTTGNVTMNIYNFYNESADADYLYPIFSIVMNGLGGNFSLTNTTDNNRVFLFTGLSANEVLTVDCSKGIISSSTGLTRMDKFNKNFFRLLPGNNSLQLISAYATFAMTYQFAKKIGA